MSKWIDLTQGMIICEICSKRFTPERFFEHLKHHTTEELEVLKKLAKKTLSMTEEQYSLFLTNLECESYARARESIKAEST